MAWLPLIYLARSSNRPPAACGWHGCQFPLVRRHMIRSGAGKTTTVRVLAILPAPDGGWVRAAGHDVAAEPRSVQRVIALAAALVAGLGERPRRRPKGPQWGHGI
jgi:hypothetical protein